MDTESIRDESKPFFVYFRIEQPPDDPKMIGRRLFPVKVAGDFCRTYRGR